MEGFALLAQFGIVNFGHSRACACASQAPPWIIFDMVCILSEIEIGR